MLILNANGISLSFADRLLFRDVTFDVYSDDRIGLVGVNGCGKTTLFKILNSEYSADDGTINKANGTTVGYMEQHVCRDSSISVYNEALSVFRHLDDMELELEEIHDRIDLGEHTEEILARQLHLTEEYERLGGLTYKSRTSATLIGLGFTEGDFLLPVEVLSGGQKSKLQLAKLLLSNTTLMLLDEPTNHLDIQSVEWLERFLLDYRGCYIVISHDRYFLDKVTNRTLELENTHLHVYKGNYSRYVEQKEFDRIHQEKVYENTMAEIKRIEGIIEQQKRWNQERNYVTIAHKQKSIDRLTETLDKPEEAPDAIKFNFGCREGGGNDVLMAKNLSLSFDGKRIFRNVNLDIKKQQRVFLLGPNGCGKSSLFKILISQYHADNGEFKYGSLIDCGYFDQNQSGLDLTKTAIDEVWDAYPKMNQTQIRTAMAAFLFKNDDVFREVGKMSGGERARIALLKLMLSGSNLLLLDEPTNHLDINSREALESALTDYNGTLFIISHDRYLINKLADKVYYLTEDGTMEHIGNYDSLSERLAQLNAPTEAANAAKKAEKPNDYKLKKERESERRKLNTRVTRAEKEIEELDTLIKEKTEELSTEEVASDYQRAMDLSDEIAQLRTKQENVMAEWEEASLALEEMDI